MIREKVTKTQRQRSESERCERSSQRSLRCAFSVFLNFARKFHHNSGLYLTCICDLSFFHFLILSQFKTKKNSAKADIFCPHKKSHYNLTSYNPLIRETVVNLIDKHLKTKHNEFSNGFVMDSFDSNDRNLCISFL